MSVWFQEMMMIYGEIQFRYSEANYSQYCDIPFYWQYQIQMDLEAMILV